MTTPESHAAPSAETPISFSFGRNWEEFIQKHFSEERVEVARKHLLEFLALDNLKSRTFLDVGCGSGIHSLAAFKSGAERILSFDVDPHSVSTTRWLHKSVGEPANWTVREGSALDRNLLATLTPADIVYSWGVLHHTGKMWEAIENVAGLIARGGYFYIAIYNTHPKSTYWLKKKTQYNKASKFGKRLMESYFVTVTSAYALMRGRNPFKEMLTYKQRRGMSYMTDMRDWLGGYPYEHATPGEVIRFGTRKLGLRVVNVEVGQGSSAVTEYLFSKP